MHWFFLKRAKALSYLLIKKEFRKFYKPSQAGDTKSHSRGIIEPMPRQAPKSCLSPNFCYSDSRQRTNVPEHPSIALVPNLP
jgi:hypothetical protein